MARPYTCARGIRASRPALRAMVAVRTATALACLAAVLGAVAGLPTTVHAATFTHTGGSQSYVVPAGSSSIRIKAYGAAGGSWGVSPDWGGLGGFVEADIAVTPGETLTVNVGGQGAPDNAPNAENAGGAGGFNGGGHGGSRASTPNGGSTAGAPGGGGASDVRRGGVALSDRVIVAGGGGGGGVVPNFCGLWASSGRGGAGGGPDGGSGQAAARNDGTQDAGTGGGGATQSGGGGAAASYWSTSWPATAGTLGQGGRGSSKTLDGYNPGQGGGGGGGFYGGGGGGNSYECGGPGGGGGGGSSWTSGTAIGYGTGVRSGHGTVLIYASAPNAPSSLSQRDSGGIAVAAGAWANTSTMQLHFVVSDPDGAETLTPWVEVRPSGTAFSASCGQSISGATFSGGAISAADAGPYAARADATGLVAGTAYHWRACAVDSLGRSSPWTEFGNVRDFGISTAPGVAGLVAPSDQAPLMTVLVDGTVRLQTYVRETTLTDFPMTASLAAGLHQVEVRMSNDYWLGNGLDRNLLVDKVTFGPSGEMFEGESMTGLHGVYANAAASAGQVGVLLGTAALTKDFTTGGASTQLTVRGYADVTPETVTTTSPTLVGTFFDGDNGDVGRVDFQLCSDAACATVLQAGSSGGGLANGSNGSWVPPTPLTQSTKYHWRVRSTDASGLSSAWSVTRMFAINEPPNVPTHVDPADGSTLEDTTPTFVARYSDPAGHMGRVDFEVCGSSTCSGTAVATGGSANGQNNTDMSWTPGTAIANGTYWWRARAIDAPGTAGAWSTPTQVTIGPPSITVSLDSADLVLSPANVTAGMDATGSTTVSVTTNNAHGYALAATDASDTYAALHATTGDTIADWTAAPGAPSTWDGTSNGYGGLSLLSVTGGKDTGVWGTGTIATDVANLRYVGLRLGTPAPLHSRSSFSTATDSIVTAYRVRPSATTTAGTYRQVVSYTVTPNA